MQNAALNYCTLYIVFVWSQLDGGKVELKNNGISAKLTQLLHHVGIFRMGFMQLYFTHFGTKAYI